MAAEPTTSVTSGVKAGRVLAVDDEPLILEALGKCLKEEGYVVDLAVDGVNALECVRAALPDAIVLNYVMPRMNGLQCLQALRAEPAYANVPVIMTMVLREFTMIPRAFGDTEVVYVPFAIEELLDKVALAVDRSHEANKSHTQPMPAPSEAPPQKGRGVIILVEHDRRRLQQLDTMLTERGYTVVSMTRARIQLARLARALRPRAILLDWVSEGVGDVVRELHDNTVQLMRAPSRRPCTTIGPTTFAGLGFSSREVEGISATEIETMFAMRPRDLVSRSSSTCGGPSDHDGNLRR
jgi:DNA-binding response OmpR family regulator